MGGEWCWCYGYPMRDSCSRCGTNICKHETHLTFLRESFFPPGRDTIVHIYTPVDFNSLGRVCWRNTKNDDYWCWRSCITTFVRVTNNIDISTKSVMSRSHYMFMMWGSTSDHSISTLGSASTMDISKQTSGKFPGLIVGTNLGVFKEMGHLQLCLWQPKQVFLAKTQSFPNPDQVEFVPRTGQCISTLLSQRTIERWTCAKLQHKQLQSFNK